jgi:hypothetical protein
MRIALAISKLRFVILALLLISSTRTKGLRPYLYIYISV